MSSQNKGGLDVSIMGREFRISCTDDEQKDLLKAVELPEQQDARNP